MATAESNTNTTVQTIFTIEQFDNAKNQWSRWVKRLEGAFTIFNVPDDKKVGYLLHYMGADAFDTLCDKLAPEDPWLKEYKFLVDYMQQYYNPAPLEIAENFRFNKRRQQEGESVQEYLTALQKLAINCNFGTYLKTALRNQFVFGLKNEKILYRLLETKDLTLERALEISVSMELSSRDVAQLHQKGNVHNIAFQKKNYNVTKTNSNHNNSNTIASKNSNSSSTENRIKKCYRCGSTKHLANKCNKINVICKFCNVKGHLQKVCTKAAKQASDTNQVEVEEIVALETEHAIFREKFKTNVIVNDKEIQFEVDSGASVSIMGKKQFSVIFPRATIIETNLKLVTYCKNSLQVLGYLPCAVIYNNHTYNLNLYIVTIDREPLLGREWIRQIKLNLWEEQVNYLNVNEVVNSFKLKFPNVFLSGVGKIEGIQASLNLKKDSKPIFMKPRTVPFALIPRVEQELENLVSEGVLTKVDHSEWATPIVPVVKRKKIRICGDFKVTINPVLDIDEHPLPTIDELFASMAGGIKFSKIDLSQAYLQLEVRPEDRHLLTLSTHKGLYRCNRLMYGVASAPAIWQREMEKILQGIPGVTVFLDDIKITGETDEIHISRLEEVLSRLSKHNLRINLQKSEFLVDKIEYCGYVIDKSGIHKMASKVEAIQNAPKPQNKSQLRSFIGLVNYYGRFFPNLSTVLHPLNLLLHNDREFVWNTECQKSFKTVKERLNSPDFLTHFDPKLPLILATDASPYGVGAVISHLYPDGTERPIQFASQTLSNTQCRYSQIDKEAYAIIFGVRKFYQFLYGRRFILYVDHKPLVQIFNPNKSLPILSATRMQHYAIFLQAFNFDIRYKSTTCHANADFVSRLPLKSEEFTQCDEPDIFEINQIETLPVTVSEVSRETARDSQLKPLLEALKSGKQIDRNLRFNIDQTEFSLQQGCIFRGIRVIIPKALQAKILNELHTAHFGLFKMKGLARSYCWWNTIDKDIEKLNRECYNCKKIMNNPKPVTNHPWERVDEPFQRVHIDYAGPFYGCYYFILVDAYSRWPEVYITRDMTSKTTTNICREIFSRFGIPTYLVSDNGRQFVSQDYECFLKQNGVKHILTAPYHPATNGLAERYVQTLKQAIRSLNPNPQDREKELQKILLQYRKMPHSTTRRSPSYLMFNREIKSRLDLIKPIDKHPKEVIDYKFKCRSLNIGDRVAVREYIHTDKWLFGQITDKIGTLHYHIRLDDNRIWKRHIDQIKQIGRNTPLEPNNDHDVSQIPRSSNQFENIDLSDNVSSNVKPREDYENPVVVQNKDINIDSNVNLPSCVVDSSRNVNSEPCTMTQDVPTLRRSTRIRKTPNRLDL